MSTISAESIWLWFKLVLLRAAVVTGTELKPPPQPTVTGQAERRSSVSWRGSCVYSLFYSLLLWMNPRVKEASKKMSGSLKSRDVAPAQRTIAEASQAPALGVHTRQPGIHMLVSLLTLPLSCVARGCNWSLSRWRDQLVKSSSWIKTQTMLPVALVNKSQMKLQEHILHRHFC